MNKNLKYRTLQAVKIGLLQSCYAQIRGNLIFVYWSSIVAHQQAMMMLRTAAKINNCMLMKNPSLQNGYLPDKVYT